LCHLNPFEFFDHTRSRTGAGFTIACDICAALPRSDSRQPFEGGTLKVHSSRAGQGTKARVEVGDKIRVDLHHGKIEDAVVRAVIQDNDGVKLQVDVVGLDLTVLIDTRQVAE